MSGDRGVPRRDLARFLRELGWSDVALAEPARPDAANTFLDSLHQAWHDCARCRLSQGRRNIVFGEGATRAPVMFVGEAPGAEEDRTGKPFVGQAGKLLDGMIFALGFDRSEVFIANVVKCRPPKNRDPADDEMTECAELLERQIELIRPRVIVALGRVSARRLTGSAKSMGALRGRWTSLGGIPLLATYHPAYLLRSPIDKRAVWEDLKAVRQRLAEKA